MTDRKRQTDRQTDRHTHTHTHTHTQSYRQSETHKRLGSARIASNLLQVLEKQQKLLFIEVEISIFSWWQPICGKKEKITLYPI